MRQNVFCFAVELGDKSLIYVGLRGIRKGYMARMKPSLFIFIAVSLALAGCKEFETIHESAALGSATCIEKVRSNTQLARIDDRLCNEMTAYTCEKRIYSPTVSNRDSLSSECGSTGQQSTCVAVRTLEFNTSVARDGQNENEFLDGGEYNRTDISCANKGIKYQNANVISADGKDVFSALNAAIAKCHERSYL